MPRLFLVLPLVLAPGLAFAQTPPAQITQPGPNQNQSQLQTNQSQQNPAASGGAQGRQMSQPPANMNQPQLHTNQSQQPPEVK